MDERDEATIEQEAVGGAGYAPGGTAAGVPGATEGDAQVPADPEQDAKDAVQNEVEEQSDESFPASDAPSWPSHPVIPGMTDGEPRMTDREAGGT